MLSTIISMIQKLFLLLFSKKEEIVSSLLLLLLLLLLFYFFHIFHTSVSWWSFTIVWMRASFLISPELFSVFLSIHTMLSSGWSWLVLRLIIPIQTFGGRSNYTSYNWYHRHPHLPQFSLSSDKISVLISLFTFLDFHFVVRWGGKVHYSLESDWQQVFSGLQDDPEFMLRERNDHIFYYANFPH